MLIHSPRHRHDDLELWKELEAADMVTPVPQRLVDQTIESISRWPGCGYVGTSWGKDSVVMLHLLSLSGRTDPVVWMRLQGRDNPDCELVRDAFLAKYSINYHERVFLYEQCLHDEQWRALGKEFGVRRMTGLRADESTTRRLSIAVHGVDTGVSFRPLAKWRLPLVFAYLAQQGLPVNPAYGCLGGGRWPREHIRTHSLGGRSGSGMGRGQWEREYYSDVLNNASCLQM